MELLIGAGRRHEKLLGLTNIRAWRNLTTLDIDPDTKPDYLWDLNHLPLPFSKDSFDEIHAYDVLEHTGQQGDWRFFFAQWIDFWRILCPDGLFFCQSPRWDSKWAWGDPGHSRVIQLEQLIYLSQAEYKKQVGVTPMTDYRHIYDADFELVAGSTTEEHIAFVLKAIK